MGARWIPGPFLGIFTGATWIKRGFMITEQPVRGALSVGDVFEMHWPSGDSIELIVKALDVESNYRPATLDRALRDGVPLRVPVLVNDPTDARLNFRRGHFFVLPEDAERFPDEMQPWVHTAPVGIILAAPGSLTPEKLDALPVPEARDYHSMVRLVDEGVI
ncbi:MAG: hypothetical protein JXB47_08960 [Anaerolineae bacterium]|nr:hypothetical protein [Anaerolineae bacterium]